MYVPSPEQDLRACRTLLRGGSRSFFIASLLLPKKVRDPASALYAFCRLADDAADVERSAGAHSIWRQRLDAAYLGYPLATPVDRAFAEVVARYGIPRTLPEALLEGLEWDLSGRQYETLAELHHYAARVAGSVGAMMAILMDRRQPEVIARACDLGVAMQLTNIARDVGEDARNDRLYLPRTWLADAGIDPNAWLAQPAYSPALASVVRRMIGAAEVLYDRAAGAIDHLPASCRPGIRSALALYREIGRQVERESDCVSRRIVVGKTRKARLVLAAATPRLGLSNIVRDPPLEATRFLVSAAAAPAQSSYAWRPAGRSLSQRGVWLIDLFERLERRQRLQPVGEE
jgi:15-cis-phytoene synthase